MFIYEPKVDAKVTTPESVAPRMEVMAVQMMEKEAQLMDLSPTMQKAVVLRWLACSINIATEVM